MNDIDSNFVSQLLDAWLEELGGLDCDVNAFYRNEVIGRCKAYAEVMELEPGYIKKEIAARIGGAVA